MRKHRHAAALERRQWLEVAGQLLDLPRQEQVRVLAVWFVDAVAGLVGLVWRLVPHALGGVVGDLAKAIRPGAGPSR